MESVSSHLAAIVFTDISGFTRLAAEDETKALALLETQRRLLKPIVEEYQGKWLKEMGDGLLLSFAGSKQAVRCAIKIQEAAKDHEHLKLRIGIHQGDIVEKDGDVYGDDVNIASRIEPFAAAGGIAISHKVLGDISGDPEFQTKYLGRPKLKGVRQKVEVYCIASHGLPVTKRSEISAKLEKQSARLLPYVVLLMLVIAGGLWFYFSGDNGDRIKTIAVLPLENLSKDPDQQYFADGMTEALIGELSNTARCP